MATYAELSALHGPEEANRLCQAEWVQQRAATAEIRVRMRVLGLAEDVAITAASLMVEFPRLPDHGVSSLWAQPIRQERVRAALKAYLAAQALHEAA